MADTNLCFCSSTAEQRAGISVQYVAIVIGLQVVSLQKLAESF